MFGADYPAHFGLNESDNRIHTLVFEPGHRDVFRSIYGYNDSGSFSAMPMCSDLMLKFQVKGRDHASFVGAVLEKYGVLYGVRVEFHGAISFLKYQDGRWTELRRTLTDGIVPGVFQSFEFANVDRRLVLRWGQKRFMYDLADDKDLAGVSEQVTPPQVQLFGGGGLDVTDVGLFRDIYYTDPGIRATQNSPFRLEDDEFFVCGDNSPNSLDSRLWDMEDWQFGALPKGHCPTRLYDGQGRDGLLVTAFRPRPTMAPIVPNFNTVRVIFGSPSRTIEQVWFIIVRNS